MNFQIKHPTVDCPPELKEMIDQKIGRFERVLPDTAYLELQLRVLAKVQKDGETEGDKEAELLLDLPGVKPVIRFVCRGMTFMEAIDCAIDRLDDHLSRVKNRDGDHNDGTIVKEMVAEGTADKGY
jgi:ribosomal subunit interface protein